MHMNAVDLTHAIFLPNPMLDLKITPVTIDSAMTGRPLEAI